MFRFISKNGNKKLINNFFIQKRLFKREVVASDLCNKEYIKKMKGKDINGQKLYYPKYGTSYYEAQEYKIENEKKFKKEN
tara:strand:- start:5497 stop:5736 length:240 start_codon:yes stop_codon:yes gene_type:complete